MIFVDLFAFFYMQSSSLTNPICLKKKKLSFIQCVFWLLCQKSRVHKCVELCLSLQFNSTEQCAGFYGNIIVQLEIGNGDTSRSYVPDIFLNFFLQCLKVFYIQMFYLFCLSYPRVLFWSYGERYCFCDFLLSPFGICYRKATDTLS